MISDVISVAMDEKMMSKTQQRVIKLITKPHNDRSNPEIDVVLCLREAGCWYIMQT